MKKAFLFLLVAFPLVAFAADPPGFINHLTDTVTSWQGATATIGIVLELVLRLIPSQQPLSVLHALARFLKVSGDFLDKILPQNIIK